MKNSYALIIFITFILSFSQANSACLGPGGKLGAQNFDGLNYNGSVNYDVATREVVTLFSKITSESDSYYAVIAEYLSPFSEDNFIGEFIKPGDENGYLEELFSWITIVKLVREPDTNDYNIYSLAVRDGEITQGEKIAQDKLSLGCTLTPLLGSQLQLTVGDNALKIDFLSPFRFTPFELLTSTWEYDYVPGFYNPGYQQSDIKVLELLRDFNSESNTATAVFDVQFLKGKQLDIFGKFTITQAARGMFTFTEVINETTIGKEKVTDKIGAFIDVYNAQPIYDTVEFILIDPADPYNSQMYFEEFGNE